MTISGSTSAVVAAPAGTVFDLITDIDRLPEWNPVVERVLERPAELRLGAEWVVRIHALGTRWSSRSRVLEFDRAGRRFAYRSVSDDGNPSHALWHWDVSDDPGGAAVTVRWEVNPRTFWRRVLLARLRGRGLTREVPASLRRLEALAQGGRRLNGGVEDVEATR